MHIKATVVIQVGKPSVVAFRYRHGSKYTLTIFCCQPNVTITLGDLINIQAFYD